MPPPTIPHWLRPAAPDLRRAGLGLRAFTLMGTEITVLAPSAEVEHGARAVSSLFQEWDQCLSRFKPESELSCLNRGAGGWVTVSPLLMSVLEESLRAAQGSGGIFDPTILNALIDAGYDRTFKELKPQPARLGRGRPAGAWRKIEVEADRVRLPAGAGLDFGGIAKGMAVDAAHDLLLGRGLPGFAIDAGGDLRIHGAPPGVPTWRVAVETAAGDLTVSLEQGALATSSVLGRRWLSGGREAHHLIDPRTGEPSSSGVVSATAAASTCAEAEVAAKVALLLGSGAGPLYLRSRHLDGLLSLADRSLLRIGNWPEAC